MQFSILHCTSRIILPGSTVFLPSVLIIELNCVAKVSKYILIKLTKNTIPNQGVGSLRWNERVNNLFFFQKTTHLVTKPTPSYCWQYLLQGETESSQWDEITVIYLIRECKLPDLIEETHMILWSCAPQQNGNVTPIINVYDRVILPVIALLKY